MDVMAFQTKVFVYAKSLTFVGFWLVTTGEFLRINHCGSNMKAIIPVAGAGTKLRPHSYSQPKALIPLAGKSVLSIIIDQLREAGISEFIFIVGYLGEKIQDHVKNKYPDLTAHYVHQVDRQGVGHAIRLTRDIVNHDEVFVNPVI